MRRLCSNRARSLRPLRRRRPTALTTGPAPLSGKSLWAAFRLYAALTAIAHDRSVAGSTHRCGAVIAPGYAHADASIPAPRAKQFYIISDCTREAKAKGVPFGNFVDPFGEPVNGAFGYSPEPLPRARVWPLSAATSVRPLPGRRH